MAVMLRRLLALSVALALLAPQGAPAAASAMPEAPNCPIYIDGEHVTTLRGTCDELADQFQRLVDAYVSTKYPPRIG